MRPASVLAGKYISTALVLVGLCDLAMVGLHACAVVGRDVPALAAGTDFASWRPTHDLSCYQLSPQKVVDFSPR